MGIKVLHLIDSGGLYGAEKMLLSLVQEQVKQGLDPMILSAGEPNVGEKAIEAEAKRKSLPIIPWRMNPGLNLKESWRILKWAQENKYNLLHSHGFKFNVLLGMYPEKIRRIPMIATLHGYVHAPCFSKMWLYESLDRFAIRRMRGVVLVGEAMKTDLPPTVVNSSKLWVIPNGLDVEGVKSLASQPVDREIEDFIVRHSPVILGVGRLSPEKGFEDLVEAISAVRGSFKDAGLIIVGEGKLRVALERRRDTLGLEDCVFIPGYSENVPGIQRRSDLLIIPSRTEGLPITLLEAMTVGVPVLVSPVGEMPSVLGDGAGGYILEDRPDVRDLCTGIEYALSDTDWKSKTAWSFEKVSNQYSVRVMEERYRNLYLSTLRDID